MSGKQQGRDEESMGHAFNKVSCLLPHDSIPTPNMSLNNNLFVLLED
jgi:hypothetical protein